MRFTHVLVALSTLLLVTACNQGNVSAPAAQVDTAGYEVTDKGDFEFLVKKDETGVIREEGHIVNGAKTGAWLTYDAKGNLVGFTNYVLGKINGVSVEMNNRGQITKKQYFDNDIANGLYGEYKFGRATKEMNYNNGQIDGEYKEYYNDGKLRRKAGYKNGKQHGNMTYYNENEEVTLEYQYDNGEKVGGGEIIKK